MKEWRCGCPICRVLVYPILKIARTSSAERGKSLPLEHEGASEEQISEISAETEIAQERPYVRIKLSEIQQTEPTQTQLPAIPTVPPSMPQQPLQPVQQPAPIPQERPSTTESETPQRSVQAEVPQQVIERIQQLEEEVSKIKNYVRASIDGIKATLVDLRSAIAELSNPFNILRKYADILFGEEGKTIPESERRRGNSHQQAQQYTQPTNVASFVPIVTYPVLTTPMALPTSTALTQSTEAAGAALQPQRKIQQRNKLNGENTSLIQLGKPGVLRSAVLWLNKAIERLGLENVSKLLDSYVKAGLLTKDTGEALKELAMIVAQLRKNGVPIEEQASIVAELFAEHSAEHKQKDESRTRGSRNRESELSEAANEELEKNNEASANAGAELLKLIEGG